MGLTVDGFEFFNAQLSFNCCRFRLLVAGQFLDKTGLGPTFEQAGGAGRPQEMTRAGAPNIGFLDELGGTYYPVDLLDMLKCKD